jgi:hypothetical protein
MLPSNNRNEMLPLIMKNNMPTEVKKKRYSSVSRASNFSPV